ncbi:uncharacterized protein MELLADRAFT_90239 [Melampsora larici-populina 98AG31]|uniref:Ribosomal lysine N-methyltransferase 4 n=1 Tax=Melampsora larici-populina (strain 98AG31 / pathotype 3-4-7) TaxID=747676 RepID=F4RW78_MELLP|nr:uncharacterized protein MELLADRAFT_90239 [Melampsora larici-populina 98AG31]EGG03367.1 hypothetical protein MELLADRAFT_90239 [Melampsora larici-populina 98AG31]
MNSSSETRIEAFNHWLKDRGVIQHPSISIHHFGHQGHGLIATEDIEAGTILFSIPRPPVSNSPLLTIGTSDFLSKLGTSDAEKISRNWIPLLMTMMWERARGYDQSVPSHMSWRPYFEMMPTEFDTLMFWSDDELKELQASTVLGKEEAEADYHQLVAPLIRSRSDLFPIPTSNQGKVWTWDDFYGLQIYHLMGSLALSRSFEVDVVPETDNHDEEEEVDDDKSIEDQDENGDISMTAASASSTGIIEEEVGLNTSEGVAMVPLADILNAKSGCENAKLFYEPTTLNMTTTKSIRKGEQIYNTYADPPNADLLRRYGHVDDENPFDLAEVSLELCIRLAAESLHPSDPQNQNTLDELKSRAKWALEVSDIDEIFMLPTKSQREPKEILPDELVIMLRILLSTEEEFQTWKSKGKVPKPAMSEPIAQLAIQILSNRLNQYSTTIQNDQDLLKDQSLSRRKLKSIKVRLGEKLILNDLLNDLNKSIQINNGKRKSQNQLEKTKKNTKKSKT